jgi:enamine deaminase RidA (YjgF/YER057c/UK114 family)
MRAIEPKGWLRGPGFSHAFATEGEELVYFSGVIGSDPTTGEIAGDGMVEQFAQAVRNVADVVAAAGAAPDRVIFLRIYVTDREAYMGNLKAIGEAFRDVFGSHYPAMTFLVVSGLFDSRSLVEIDGVAAIAGAGEEARG